MRGVRFDEDELAIVRRAYARQITTIAGVGGSRPIEDAFASVKREAFLGPGPWLIRGVIGAQDYLEVPSPDAVLAYQDLLFGLKPERKLNNGQPSLHAKWLAALDPPPGARILHVGTGAGYYTAVLSRLVGEAGHIVGVEFDPDLFELARRNLSAFPNVTVVNDDGAAWPKQEVDGIYVNFGVGRPAPTWLDHLALGGRLIFPLGVPSQEQSPGLGRTSDRGAALRVSRTEHVFGVTWLGPCWFVCAEGSLRVEAEESERLRTALNSSDVRQVRSLRWREPPDPEHSWFIGSDWSLSTGA